MSSFSSRPLFGGALSTSLPASYLDVSDVRQVPDTQEVHVSRAADDVSCIVELLQCVLGEGDECVKFHFDSLAHDNSASSSSILSIFALPTTTPFSPAPTRGGSLPAPLCLVGEQALVKYGRAHGTPECVRVWLAVYRLAPAANIDVVLSVNEPLGETALRGTQGMEASKAKEVFEEAARSLKIHDWAVFAE